MGNRILIRHAQSQFNAGNSDNWDSDITERGKYQLQEAALHVKEWIPEDDDSRKEYTLFVSPFLRTLRTALPINRRFDIKTIVDCRIGEEPTDMLGLQGEKIVSREEEFPTFDWSRFPKDGFDANFRSTEQYHSDLESFIKEMPENCIVVTHMTPVRDLTSGLFDNKIDGKKMQIPNCSLTLVEDGCLLFVGRK